MFQVIKNFDILNLANFQDDFKLLVTFIFQLLAKLGVEIIAIAITQKFDGEGLEKITIPENIIEIPNYDMKEIMAAVPQVMQRICP